MNNSFQFLEIDLIPAVGISTTLTRSQHENFVIISSLWKGFKTEIHKIEIYVPLETGPRNDGEMQSQPSL